ncbi:gfo/Idh/MocA family oxidoreductase [Anaerobacillus alkaliphilus]|uniref:Gfo/Idh/MocA family oxidoreductase n=1 Tax=Anaerobacillus alkaliphilus TaxID=1548597 RepID=A0A4Q0VUU6_9BACI|nr:Gfo/Idh/MocA family oxidoreductase [Anaerobacillus alkaliphilus]RXJ02564.1 gfo/Idh/MocA family oxidoreductase [Anaerobacillus alkaliphilus]
MVRFGLVGTNWITEQFIEAASLVEGFELTAVYSRTSEKGEQFASKYQLKHTFTSLEEMASSDQLDAIYIASPNSLHAEQACLFMNYGKHVLVEKPMASNSSEVQFMIETAKQNNVLLMEAVKSSFVPSFQVIKDHLHKLGPVRRFVASYCQYSSRYDAFKNGTLLNAFDPTFSNGSLMDIGIYCIYPSVILFGKPNQVKANGYLLSSGVDGEGSLLLSYDQMETVIFHSKITNSYLPSEIQGENGTMIIDKLNVPEHVEIRYRDGSSEVFSKEQVSNSMYYEVKEFIYLINNNRRESEMNSYENSYLTALIMEDARKQMGLVFPADKKN